MPFGPFGSKKKKQASAREANEKLQETIDLLEKKVDFLQTLIDKQVELAKGHVKTGHKKALIGCLKKKNVLAENMEKLSDAKLNLEVQQMTISHAATTREYMSAVEFSTQVLRDLNSAIDTNEIPNILDNAAAAMEDANYAADLLGEPLNPTPFDDDQLLKEWEQEQSLTKDEELRQLEKQLLSVDAVTVPAKKVSMQELSEDEQLKELERMVIMDTSHARPVSAY